MSQQTILNLLRLPGRLDVSQTSQILGFSDHDIPVLIRARLLKCLGNPAPNAPKYFSACEVQKLAADEEWLNKASRALSNHWRLKNQHRRATSNGKTTSFRPEMMVG